ncbi:hypothetical protein [Microseira sp. BLCC-F43]|uniref:hypothetical protein n=1 Tax=Microseira sp. BLCC-F43 TaxID=3153602 RepID=UPI0035BB9A23
MTNFCSAILHLCFHPAREFIPWLIAEVHLSGLKAFLVGFIRLLLLDGEFIPRRVVTGAISVCNISDGKAFA